MINSVMQIVELAMWMAKLQKNSALFIISLSEGTFVDSEQNFVLFTFFQAT